MNTPHSNRIRYHAEGARPRGCRRLRAAWHFLALTAATSLSMVGTPAVQASESVAAKLGCLGCHAVATQLVGPAYQAVAEKYAGQADAVAVLVASIRKGGSGKWGDVPMPPQPTVSEADAKRLAVWILRAGK